MKRDLDLIRDILLRIEEEGDPTEMKVVRLNFSGYDPLIVTQHAKLLKEAGYIKAHDIQNVSGLEVLPMGLTWQGHEFVAVARNDDAWEGLKVKAQEYGGSLPLEVVKSLLLQDAEARLR